MSKLKGYKTHIFAVLIGLTAAAGAMGWVSPEIQVTLYGLFGAGGLTSVRSALKNK